MYLKQRCLTVVDINWIFLPSYMTTTFVVEAMAAANAQLRWKRMEKRKVGVGFRFPFSAVFITRGSPEISVFALPH